MGRRASMCVSAAIYMRERKIAEGVILLASADLRGELSWSVQVWQVK